MSLRLRLGNAKGTSTLEFIVVVPFLLFIFLAGVELSRAWLTANIAQNAVREGARIAVVTPVANDPIGTGTARITSILGSLPVVSGPAVTCNGGGNNSCVPDAVVLATVTVQFQTVVPLFLPQIGTFDITQTARMRYE